MLPCPHLEIQSGIWKFSASKLNQTQLNDGIKYATGIRNAVALEWSDEHKKIYFLNHGRDALFLLYPEYYSAEDSAELPSEEMHILKEGGNYGWPYTYYDHIKGERIVAPEYGGDGQAATDEDIYEQPIANFPGHWAPNDMLFYQGDQFPEYFKKGAFIVWHGSWNRAPIQQAGYLSLIHI